MKEEVSWFFVGETPLSKTRSQIDLGKRIPDFGARFGSRAAKIESISESIRSRVFSLNDLCGVFSQF